MTTPQKEISALITSDEIHNKNCFNYLRNLKIPDFLLESLPKELAPLAEIKNGSGNYKPEFPYGDLYKRFFDYIDDKTVIDELYSKKLPKHRKHIESKLKLAEARLGQQQEIGNNVSEKFKIFVNSYRTNILPIEIEQLKKEQDTLEKQLDDFFISIYANDNNILEETYEVIKDITLKHTPISSEIKSSIAKRTKDSGELINQESQSPSKSESPIARVRAVYSKDYKPQHTTSLATERHYKWNKKHSVKEYRFGTQGQRHEGAEQISPLFRQFLKVQDKRAQKNRQDIETLRITHIYFNNLGRDRSGFEGKKESGLTSQLEQLEPDHPNIAVITLPADQGLMDHHDYKKTTPTQQYDDVRKEFLQISSQDPTCTQPIKDFYISQRIREALFKDKDEQYSIEAEKAQLGKFIDDSFTELGIKKGTKLSPSQKQAVWFHFIKSKLTNHVIDTFKPQEPNEQLSINFSCKDAIDRGGVSSAYYNLINSFNSDSPMSREEFERALHAAPTMVKGRGINDHIKILWNTINLYVNNNYETLRNDPDKLWLIEWRDMNCPKARTQEVLGHRIPQLKQQLEEAKKDSRNTNKLDPINRGLIILKQINDQINKGVSGKRLLLEAAVRTPVIALNPTEDDINRYEKLSDKITIKSPALNIIAGLMKALVGLIVYEISRSKKSEMLNEGLATVQTGVEEATRKDLQSKMKEQLQELRSTKDIKQNNEEEPVSGLSIS